MNWNQPAANRETIWGIKPDDRVWFQTLTTTGGACGAIVLIILRFAGVVPAPLNAPPASLIPLDIGACFIAAGFSAWTLLYYKEVIVTLADLIRSRMERRMEKRVAERVEERVAEQVSEREAHALERGLEQGREEGRAQANEALRELISQSVYNSTDAEQIVLAREDVIRLLQQDREEGRTQARAALRELTNRSNRDSPDAEQIVLAREDIIRLLENVIRLLDEADAP